ncbi:sigma factor-like helix-turn-helix DNA-binding protein [Arthrobacter sp. UC242_113]|uniref:sigma factor-like helix-turn-helix DNA-binding protein n=1 Tax=Arthrobacter sp. UC242_113 TaxID=3374550 RepID=UPI00375822C8
MTTTPELSREQRDAAMVERYSNGETLDAIGQSFGVTRERVRQMTDRTWLDAVRSVQK